MKDYSPEEVTKYLMYCGVNNLTTPHLWLHMFCYFLNNTTLKITILSVQSWSSVAAEKRKWLDALCTSFPLHYQLVIFLHLSIVITSQYHAGFPTSAMSYLPSSCVVQYRCSEHSERDILYCLSNSFLTEWRMSHTLKGWIWSSDMVLLVDVEDELKRCRPRGYLEHKHHTTPHHTTQPSRALSSDCGELWTGMQWQPHATWSMRMKFIS